MRATYSGAHAPAAVAAAGHRPPRLLRAPLARCALPLAALGVGLFSLTTVKESAIGPYGLIQALPALYFVALGAVAVIFLLGWRAEKPHYPQFILTVATLVILLQGAPSIAENEPRFPPAWLHAGFTDYVAGTGRVLPQVDARFSWPSFFTGMAMLDRTGGLPSAITILKWWPVFIGLLYLPPLFLLASRLLGDEKKAMLVVFLFPLANWVGQDYYSPQSVGYLLYLVLLCVVLGPFGASRGIALPRRRKPPAPEPCPLKPAHVATLLVVMLVLCAAMVTGHQLTPFFALITVTVLVFFGRTRLLVWPAVMFLLTVGWVCYAAVAYWSGHFGALFGNLGAVGSNYSRALRLHGSPTHYRVDDVRLLMFGGIWALAFIGFFLARRTGVNRVAAAVAMLSPAFVLGAQSYGGEAGLRAFLFSLPGALCLAAVALTSVSARARLVLATLLTMALIPGFLVARWGNELSEMVQPSEIAGVRHLYSIAQPGLTLMSITPQIVWEFTPAGVGSYHYAPNNLDEFAFGSVAGISALLKGAHGSYVVITRSQLEYAEQSYGLPANWGSTVERRLSQSHLFRLVYRNPGTVIYQYVEHP